MKTFKKLALAVAVSSGLVLTGCGGGGGGGGDPVVTDPSTPPTGSPDAGSTVVGSAVKGVMKNAVVTAFELNTSGDRLASVGSTTTDNQGEYSIELGDNYSGGVVEIEITVSSATRMVCDASKCGEVNKGDEVELPANFKLNAIGKASAAGSSVSVPVTPWSTMAAKRAKVLIGQGKNLSEASRQSKSEVSQVAGFDIENTKARGISNLVGASAAEAQAAVMNAVVAELIFAGGNIEESFSKLENFASALDDGVVGGDGDSFSTLQLSEATQRIAAETPNLNSETKDLLNNQTAQYDSSPTGVAPTNDPNLALDEGSTQAEKIEAFQRFVAQARSWAQSIEDLDSAVLGAAIQVDADTISAVLGDGSLNALQVALEIVGQSLEQVIIDAAGVQTALNDGTSIETNIMNDGVSVGTAELTFADENGLVMSVVGSVTGAGTTNLPFDFVLQTGLPVSGLDLQNGVVTNLLSSTVMKLTGFVSNGSGIDLARLNGVEARLNLSSGVSAAAPAGISGEQLSAQFQNASLSGDVELAAVSGESFRGAAEARIVRLISNQRVELNDAPVSIERLRLTGNFDSGDGKTFTTSALLNVNNASSFDTFSWLDYSQSFRYVNEPVTANLIELFAPDIPADAVQTSISLDVWGGPDENRDGFIWSNAYLADGAEKNYYVNLDTATISEVTAAAKAAIVDSLPAELTFTYVDPVSLLDETFTLDVLAMVQSGPAYFSGSFGNPEFNNVNLNVYPETRLMPEGVEYAEALTDSGADSAFLFDFGATEELYLTFSSDAIVSNVGAAAGTVSNTPQDAVVTSVDADEVQQWGAVNFTRPAELVYYEECLADPVNLLPSLGVTWFNPAFGDGSFACADATLTFYPGPQGELDPETLATADGIVQQALEARYGAIAQDLTIYGYNLGSFGGDAYVSAPVEFPNLESASNFIDASFTVSSRVDIPELRAATVTATATRNSFLGGRVLANVRWDGGQYSLRVSSDNLEQPGSVSVRFFNPQGYELAVNVTLNELGNVANIEGDAFINGEDIGDVELRNGAPVITYPNGEETIFETLF